MIIPSINRATYEEAAANIKKAEEFLLAGAWLHVDVADGHFTKWQSWGNPAEFAALKTPLQAEVHLMIADPEAVVASWLAAGAKRLIVPLQVIKDIDFLVAEVTKARAELAISFDVTVPIESALPYLEDFRFCHVLAVHPGRSGQEFEEESLGRVKFLRAADAGVRIEVDGGIDLAVAKRALAAGADYLVAGHYIFDSDDPAAAFAKLNAL